MLKVSVISWPELLELLMITGMEKFANWQIFCIFFLLLLNESTWSSATSFSLDDKGNRLLFWPNEAKSYYLLFRSCDVAANRPFFRFFNFFSKIFTILDIMKNSGPWSRQYFSPIKGGDTLTRWRSHFIAISSTFGVVHPQNCLTIFANWQIFLFSRNSRKLMVKGDLKASW